VKGQFDGRIILNCILKKYGVRVWMDSFGSRTAVSSYGLSERRGMYLKVELLSASQEWLCSMEFVDFNIIDKGNETGYCVSVSLCVCVCV
jgi:hypothetical protein